MISIDEMQTMLDDLAQELPADFYRELNGGILLLNETKRNTTLNTNDLFILGEYHRNGSMGRFITMYYGSFAKVYWHLSGEQMKTALRKTLRHEFRHHMESLAGERGLEIEDAKFLNEYRKRRTESEK